MPLRYGRVILESRFYKMQVKDRLIVALDVDTLPEALELLRKLDRAVSVVKVGAQFLSAEGPQGVQALQKQGYGIFYDAKFHDIPRTVKAAVKVAARLGVQIVNVHASGGQEMMRAAAQAACESAEETHQTRPLVLGVTVLTSLHDRALQEECGFAKGAQDQVVHLARQAQLAGLDGVVASPQEIQLVRQACGEKFIVLTPGIRPLSAGLDDQKRVLTPGEAMQAGADYIVVGRPIYAASNPKEAAQKILLEMQEALK
jgi:orotidine-5'-phosphate decarboxylase